MRLSAFCALGLSLFAVDAGAQPAPAAPRVKREYLYHLVAGEAPVACEAAGAVHGAACEEACFQGYAVESCVKERDGLEALIADDSDRFAADAIFSDCLSARRTDAVTVATCVASCVEQRGAELCRSVVPVPAPNLSDTIAAPELSPAREWFLSAEATAGYLFGKHDPDSYFVPAAGRLRVGLTVRGWEFRFSAYAQGLSRFALGVGAAKGMDPIPVGSWFWTPLEVGLEVYPSAASLLLDARTMLRIPIRTKAPYGGHPSWRLSLGLTGAAAFFPSEQFIAPTAAFGADLGL